VVEEEEEEVEVENLEGENLEEVKEVNSEVEAEEEEEVKDQILVLSRETLEKITKDFFLSKKMENLLKEEDLEEDLEGRLMMREDNKKELLVMELNLSQEEEEEEEEEVEVKEEIDHKEKQVIDHLEKIKKKLNMKI
jgi:hypothetical protein